MKKKTVKKKTLAETISRPELSKIGTELTEITKDLQKITREIKSLKQTAPKNKSGVGKK